MRKILLNLLTFVVVTAPLLVGWTPSASADFHTKTYQFLVGTGPLCELPELNPCPTISEDHRTGDRVELTGEGTFQIHLRMVSGGGVITHKTSTGEVVARGGWTVDRLLGFIPYGCGGDEFPDNFCGGLAILRVMIKPDTPDIPSTPAILFINCLIGRHPEGQHEGVQLIVPRFGFVFNHEISGLTLFIKQ